MQRIGMASRSGRIVVAVTAVLLIGCLAVPALHPNAFEGLHFGEPGWWQTVAVAVAVSAVA